MRKLIEGVFYDTESALLRGVSNADNVRTELRQKRTGEYFLVRNGEGKLQFKTSKRGVYYPENWSIHPLTASEARQWAMENLPSEQAERVATPSRQLAPDPDVKMQLLLPKSLADRLRAEADQEGLSVSAYVRKLLQDR